MSFFQWLFAILFVVSIAVSVAGIITVLRARELRGKSVWLLGCLFGFAGIRIDWARPDDLFLSFGVAIPVFSIVWTGSGAIIAKAMFPIVAAAAIWKVRDDAQLRKFRREQGNIDDEDAANQTLERT